MKPPPPTTIRCVTSNTDKERDGDEQLLTHLLSLFPGPRSATTRGRGVLFLQEVGHGLESTRVRGFRLKVRRRRRVVVGDIGVHRGVALGFIDLDGAPVRCLSVHGLHLRTSGRVAQAIYFTILGARTRRWNRLGKAYILGVDGNIRVPELATRLAAGASASSGVVGIILSPGLVITGHGIDPTPIARGWSDHPAVWADVRRRITS